LPLVGIVIGALAGLAAWGVSFIAPAPFVVAVAFAGPVILSGAVHVDGLLDACDALFASVTPERRLEIMKDPRHGTFAIAGFAVVATLWIAALCTIAPATLPAALAFAGGAARFAAVVNAFAVPYGRAGASARAFEQRPPLAVLALCGAILAAIALGARAPLWLLASALACAAALAIGRWAAQRLGGVLVGDVYGATIVVLDASLLTGIALLQGH
jgi:adenosylcobinamide-GDP ribazoletransferase